MVAQSKTLPVFSAQLLHPRYAMTWLMLGVFYLFSWLPVAVIDVFAEGLAALAWRRNKKRVHYACVNLALCFPDKTPEQITQLARRHFSYQMKSVMHYGLIWWAPKWRLQNMVRLQGAEQIDAIHAEGKQVIALTSHSVGLEFAVTALSLRYPCSGLYKAMKNRVIDWLVAKGRTRFGVNAYTREQGFRPLIRDTRKGRVMIYLADEDLGADRCVFAPFFGVQKATVPVLGRLAKQCRAEVLPCVSCYDAAQRKYIVKLLPAMAELDGDDDVTAATQMNRAIEQTVRECLAQYFWTLRLFKTRPPGEDSVYG